jgi:hypothetical protein
MNAVMATGTAAIAESIRGKKKREWNDNDNGGCTERERTMPNRSFLIFNFYSVCVMDDYLSTSHCFQLDMYKAVPY